MRIFQLSPAAFSTFNCAPQLIKASIQFTDDDGLSVSGHVKYFDHAWYKLGARGPTVPAASIGFLIDVVPMLPLGAYAIGLRGESSIYASHFIRTSGSLHRVKLLENVYSSWSFDRSGYRTQSGLPAPWEGVGRHHTVGVFFDRANERFYTTIDGVPVHDCRATADAFYPVLRVEAIGVEGAFDMRFENIRLVLLDDSAAEVLQYFDAWATDFAPVFISYSHEDAGVVQPFRDALRRCGVRVLGDWDFRPGESLLQRIGTSIKRAGHVLICLSGQSVASRWVQQELELAISSELLGSGLRVVPIVIGSCQIPMFLQSRLYHDVRPPNPLVSDQLLGSLRAHSW